MHPWYLLWISMKSFYLSMPMLNETRPLFQRDTKHRKDTQGLAIYPKQMFSFQMTSDSSRRQKRCQARGKIERLLSMP